MSANGPGTYGILLGSEEPGYNPAVIYSPDYTAVPTSVDWNANFSTPNTLCITNRPQALSAFKNDLAGVVGNLAVPGTLSAPAATISGSLSAASVNTPLLKATAASVTTLTVAGSTLGPLAFSTAYASLTGTPVISTVGRTGSWTDILGKPTWGAAAYSNLYSDLTGAPSFGRAAFSNKYTDLDNLPSIPLGTQWTTIDGSHIRYPASVAVGTLTVTSTASLTAGLALGTATAVRWDNNTQVSQDPDGSLRLSANYLRLGNFLGVGPTVSVTGTLTAPQLQATAASIGSLTITAPVSWVYVPDGVDVDAWLGLRTLPKQLWSSRYGAGGTDVQQADGTFKAPRTGLYAVSVNLRFDNAASEIALVLVAVGNGAFGDGTRLATASSTVGSVCVSWNGVLNAGDCVGLAAYSSSSNSITAGAVTGSASFALVHEVV